jgi:hypothetical protein
MPRRTLLKPLEIVSPSPYYRDGSILVDHPSDSNPWRQLNPGPSPAARRAMRTGKPVCMYARVHGCDLARMLAATMYHLGSDGAGKETFAMVMTAVNKSTPGQDLPKPEDLQRVCVTFVAQSGEDDSSESDSDDGDGAAAKTAAPSKVARVTREASASPGTDAVARRADIQELRAHIHTEFNNNMCTAIGIPWTADLSKAQDRQSGKLNDRLDRAHIHTIAMAAPQNTTNLVKLVNVEAAVRKAWDDGSYEAASALLDANEAQWGASRIESLYFAASRPALAVGCANDSIARLAIVGGSLLYSTEDERATHAIAYDLRPALLQRPPPPEGDAAARASATVAVVQPEPAAAPDDELEPEMRVAKALPAHVVVYADGRAYVHLPFLFAPVVVVV